MTIRVLVVDDEAAVRAGLALVLGTADDIDVVGEAGDGEQAVLLARTLRPDVVLMDIVMPRMDGVAATQQLAGIADVLVLTTFDLDEYVYGALRAGAAGFLLKTTEAAGLLEAVRLVAKGDGMIAPELTRRVIRTFADSAGDEVGESPDRPRTGLSDLTSREREVLTEIGAGLSNQEIAESLDMALATTKSHVSRILAKLGLRSRVQAAIVARQWGLARDPIRPGSAQSGHWR